MKALAKSLILAAACGSFAGVARADLRLLPAVNPVCVFCGLSRNISLMFSNSSNQDFTAEIRARMFQTASATAVQTGDVAWKALHVLPRQMVLESAALDFPNVKAETKFLVQWLEGSNHVIGITTIWVYPENLLAELKPLLGRETLGVLDPNNDLKPLLRQNGVEFVDLSQTSLEYFSGRLAILGPFQSKAQMPSGLAEQVRALAKKGVAAVLLLPPLGKADMLLPSFYFVATGTNAVLVAQADTVSRLPENPRAQLNLIYFCKQAMSPEPLSLPNLTPKP
jgi:hypothetical protein